MIQVRAVELADAEAWTRLREALWPDDGDAHAAEVHRFFTGPAGGALLPEAVLVAVDSEKQSVVGFAELSRQAVCAWV